MRCLILVCTFAYVPQKKGTRLIWVSTILVHKIANTFLLIHLILCMLGSICYDFLLANFLKTKITLSRNTIRVSKGFDPDQHWRFSGTDLGSTCL